MLATIMYSSEGEVYNLSSNAECMHGEELSQSKEHEKINDLRERGYMEHGCQHYRRRCRIRAPCCNEIFHCRHCHNEAKDDIRIVPKLRHDIPRHQVKHVICSLCGIEQEVQQNCINCGVCMGKYFCGICKLFDDDVSKKQYHCGGCGICRTGGSENYFHCDKCGCCHSTLLKNSHACVEKAMHHDCPVCFEYLFESMHEIAVLPCGHTIHINCLNEMRQHLQYACPLCSKSVFDMSKVWEKFDLEIAATPMPELYQNKMVWILCNDCGRTSNLSHLSLCLSASLTRTQVLSLYRHRSLSLSLTSSSSLSYGLRSRAPSLPSSSLPVLSPPRSQSRAVVAPFVTGDRSSRSPNFLLAFSNSSASFAQPGPNLQVMK